MTNFSQMRIEDIQDGKDGWARTIKLTIDDKVIITPSTCPPLSRTQNFDDLALRLRLEGQTTGHTGCYIVRGFDYERVLREPMQSLGQETLAGGYQNPILRQFLQTNVFIFDPSAESMEYYWHLTKLSSSRSTPPEALRLLRELAKLDGGAIGIRRAAVWKFWCDLNDKKEDRRLDDLLGHTFERGTSTGANIVLPFTIVVRNKGSFIISKVINEYWKQRCGFNGSPTVVYLLLSREAFRNHDLITEICQWVEKCDANYVVLKVKNADFSIPHALEAREEYGRLLLAFARLRSRRYNEVTTIALDCGNQVFLNAIKSFDIVATSMTAFDIEKPATGGADPIPLGSALELDEMVALSGNYWKTGFQQLGEMPCNHNYCHTNITTFDERLYPAMRWNADRCVHNMLTVDEWMYQIAQGIIEGEAKLIPNKLFNSQLRVYGSIVPAEGSI
jgi:hypothetical protein